MKKKEQGRSTLEIIGVLAVLVFLTIGGLQVYSGVQSSLISAHLEEEVLKEATIKKHENAKADDTDAHEVSRQGAHKTTITSQNGTEGTEQDLFWVTINDINVTAEQKVCQKLLASPKITEQEWLGLKTILVNGKIVENCPEEIQTITYYFEKRKILNLEDILLDNPDCPNTICPTHATCVDRKITTCEAGYKISSNGCKCEKCTGRFICDGTKDSQECPEGTKPNANHTQCDDCVAGDELCCSNGAVVSNNKDCGCDDYLDCPLGFVCEEGICTCDQAECPLCKDESKKCWDATQKQCIPCSPSSFITQDTCIQNGFQWCEAVEECKLKTDECPECDEHTDCSNATPKCNTATQTCEACPDETPNWNESTSSCVQCTDNSHCSSGQGCDTATNTCVGCGAGYRTTETGCEICPIGTYSSDGLECLSCPVNTYSNTEGASECTECDLNNSYYTELQGSTECTYCNTYIQCTKEDLDCTWYEYVCVKNCVNYLTEAGIEIKDEWVSDKTKDSNSELEYNGDLEINNDVNMHGCNLTVNGTLEIQKDKRLITEGTITINQSSTGSGLLNLGEIQAKSLNINKTTGGCEDDYIYAAFRNEGTATINTINAKSSGHEAGSGGVQDCPVDIYNTGTIEANEIKTDGTNKDSSGIYMKGGKITASNITSTVQHTPIYILDGTISADSLNCSGNESVSLWNKGRIEANNFTIDNEGLVMREEGVVEVKEELNILNGGIDLANDAQLQAGSITVTGGSSAGVSMQGSSKMKAENLTSTNHKESCFYIENSSQVEITGATTLQTCTGNGIYLHNLNTGGIQAALGNVTINNTSQTSIITEDNLGSVSITAQSIKIENYNADQGIKLEGENTSLTAGEINVTTNNTSMLLNNSKIEADTITLESLQSEAKALSMSNASVTFKNRLEAKGGTGIEISGTIQWNKEGDGYIDAVGSSGYGIKLSEGIITAKHIKASSSSNYAIHNYGNSSITADIIEAGGNKGIYMNKSSYNSPFIQTKYLNAASNAVETDQCQVCIIKGGGSITVEEVGTITSSFGCKLTECTESSGKELPVCTAPYCSCPSSGVCMCYGTNCQLEQ